MLTAFKILIGLSFYGLVLVALPEDTQVVFGCLGLLVGGTALAAYFVRGYRHATGSSQWPVAGTIGHCRTLPEHFPTVAAHQLPIARYSTAHPQGSESKKPHQSPACTAAQETPAPYADEELALTPIPMATSTPVFQRA